LSNCMTFKHTSSVFRWTCFFDGDGAVLAERVHRVGDDLADGGVPVGGKTVATCLISSLSLTFLAILAEVVDGGVNGLLDAALEADRARAGG